ncbi:MAG: nitrophenyl compound nitroreductase subunit ArsF family protein [Prosthecobacter sp.]|uniref:nitrophenyl compound nitroreductase subunit ArsF family protein n=1 Tax=Prosthecobacter sp. TaxID=1965333 RepID=UPI002603CB52|nr:nitrophenyl compound nitroreductase subunit ArsF family protein [Prosthecobacter sp.]MCF7790274.1 nitrophenyl compound nitroreductase subunit ArsF family protein [Prosthecobacter sp.]
MRLAFNLTRFALLTLVVVSLGTWSVRTFSSARAAGAGEALPADGIVVVNFHATTRCNACREIGTQAQTFVETNYGGELKSGRMNWRVINFEEPASKHFVQDYGLTTSTIVVVRRKAGRDVAWQRLDAVWDHLFDGPAMRAYLKEHISQLTLP